MKSLLLDGLFLLTVLGWVFVFLCGLGTNIKMLFGEWRDMKRYQYPTECLKYDGSAVLSLPVLLRLLYGEAVISPSASPILTFFGRQNAIFYVGKFPGECARR